MAVSELDSTSQENNTGKAQMQPQPHFYRQATKEVQSATFFNDKFKLVNGR